MGAHRVGVRTARQQLVARAQEQLDSIGPTIATLEHAVEAGKGGILCQRRLRTLLTERNRLEQVVAQDRERRDAERDS